MKIIKKDYKKGFIKLKIENLDDLWYTSYIIDKSDIIKAKTYRKIKLGEDTDRNKKVIKRAVYLAIEIEKFEFSKYTNVFRISGIIKGGPEDIPLGDHHTINLEEGSEFSLQKASFLKYQIDKIEESAKDTHSKILICVHDRDEAYFAMLKKYGFELISQIKGNVAKKADVKTESSDFYPQIKKVLEEYDAKYNFSNIIIASPGFWKEYIQKIMKDPIKKKIVYATCSAVGSNGINEVIKRPEVQTVLKQEKFASEIKEVEKLLEEIGKNGKAEYGLKEVKKAIDLGAVSDLLITDDLIHKKRQEEKFEEIDFLMRKVESMQGKIHLISSEHSGGKKLDGLGGIGSILRYKI
ncbi:mRNA surveillance protein pelota [archaeon]|jgi:protein pelota|nr:mRNA surveillance protein pelota [archaeon]MBT6773636.1 mRNA surveillance protein pelota [archaeon]